MIPPMHCDDLITNQLSGDLSDNTQPSKYEKKGKLGKADPYVKLTYGKQKAKSKTVKNDNYNHNHTSHDDQLELNNAEEVVKTSSRSLTDIKKSSENKIFDGLQKNSSIRSELSDT